MSSFTIYDSGVADWTDVLNDRSAVPAFHKLCDKITDAMKKCSTKSSNVKGYSVPRQPWMTNGLLRSIVKKNNLRKKVKMQPFNLSLLQRFKKYSNTLSMLLRNTKRSYYQSRILTNGNDSRKNWH